MVKFPDGFVQLRYAGYFWHPESSRVFSLKTGVLKPLALNKVRGSYRHGVLHMINEPNFCLSVGGRRVVVAKHLLKAGQFVADKQEISVWHSK